MWQTSEGEEGWMMRREGVRREVKLMSCALFILLFPLPSVFTSHYRVFVTVLR